MKYDCTKSLDYSHELKRLCLYGEPTFGCLNYECPLRSKGCFLITAETVAILQEWSDEHPIPKLTKREHDFLSMIVDDGLTIKRTRMGLGIYSKTDEGLMFLDWRYFGAVDRGRIWTVEELLKLEVEE